MLEQCISVSGARYRGYVSCTSFNENPELFSFFNLGFVGCRCKDLVKGVKVVKVGERCKGVKTCVPICVDSPSNGMVDLHVVESSIVY